MSRHVLIRRGEGATLVPEARIPLEAELHEALTTHPGLIPTLDMGFGRCAVVGRETALASGYADLVLLDEWGQIALVEVKAEGNPDTRRVVAQLLDYAAAMWGQTIQEFEQAVLSGHLGRSTSIRSFLEESFPTESSDDESPGERATSPDDAFSEAISSLSTTLEEGSFTLVVAAPRIPPGVEQVLDYLNARGLRVFGVEYSYFADGSVAVLVPRLVVSPSPQAQRSRAKEAAASITFDREQFLTTIPLEGRSFVANLMEAAVEAGATLKLTPGGFVSITVRAGGEARSLCQIETTRLWVGPFSKHIAPEPIEAMHRKLDAALPGRKRANAIRFLELTEGPRDAILEALSEMFRSFAR